MVILSQECFADTGVSIKVFMPFLYNKLLMFARNIFGFGKLTRFHSDRLSKHNLAFYDKNGLRISALHVDVDWCVVIAVKEESESVLGEYYRHDNFSLAN